jgi:hypothetical protein
MMIWRSVDTEVMYVKGAYLFTLFFRINIEGSVYFYIMMLQKLTVSTFSSMDNFYQVFETCLQNYENQVNCQ